MLYIKTSLPFPTLTQRINDRAADPDFPLSGLQFIDATDNRAAWIVGNCAILATGDDAGATLRLRVTMPYGKKLNLWGIDDAARYAWDEILSNLGEVTGDLQKHLALLFPTENYTPDKPDGLCFFLPGDTGKRLRTPTDPATVAREWVKIEKPTQKDRAQPGRKPLSDDEKEERRLKAQEVLELAHKEDISQEKACARLGVVYRSFREWLKYDE